MFSTNDATLLLIRYSYHLSKTLSPSIWRGCFNTGFLLISAAASIYMYCIYMYSNRHTTSGQSRVYRFTQLRTDGVHCRESAGTGPANIKVVPNGCCLGRSPCAIPFILDVRLVDAPAGVTQKEQHTGFLHLPSAVLAPIFIARRIQPSPSLVDREVEFLCTHELIVLHYLLGVIYIYIY